MRFVMSAAFTGLALIVVVAVVSLPLVTVHRSTCGRGDTRGNEYNVVLPWNEPPSRCRAHQSGFEIVREAVGLE